MKVKAKFPVTAALPAFVLLVAAAYLFIESSYWRDYAQALEEENAALNASLADTVEELQDERRLSESLGDELLQTKTVLNETNDSLNRCYNDLALETELYENCTQRNEELVDFLFKTKGELENLSSELEGFQEQIDTAMSWFVANSNIENMSARIKYLVDRCSSSTEINAACIPVVMKEEDRWSYKTEEGDRLLSLEEMMSNRGGDCEDWALFFKASYNYLKEDEREKSIISAASGTGDFRIYNDFYYLDAVEKEVGTTGDNVYVICYDSHCVVAVSGEEIKNSSDVQKLEGAYAVECQNGEYLFRIGSIGAPKICSSEICPPSNYTYPDIWLVITDDDIYDFHYAGEWTGYRDYSSKAGIYREQIEAIKQMIGEKAV